jgi:2-methylcitrate dehydratase
VVGGGRTLVEHLGAFAAGARFENISEQAREQLKLRMLDSLGCGLDALGTEVPALVRTQVDEFGGAPLCALIGGGRGAPTVRRSTTAR